MCLLRDLHFTLLYVVVSQQFDKQLYLTSCLNAHNHNTSIHLPQNRFYCAKDSILYYKCKIAKQVLAANTIIID